MTLVPMERKTKNLDLELSVCSTNTPRLCLVADIQKGETQTNPCSFGTDALWGFATDFKRDPFPRTQHFLKWLVRIEVNQPQVFQNLLNIACGPPYTGVSRSTKGKRNFPHRLDPCFPFCAFHLFPYPSRSLAAVWSRSTTHPWMELGEMLLCFWNLFCSVFHFSTRSAEQSWLFLTECKKHFLPWLSGFTTGGNIPLNFPDRQ